MQLVPDIAFARHHPRRDSVTDPSANESMIHFCRANHTTVYGPFSKDASMMRVISPVTLLRETAVCLFAAALLLAGGCDQTSSSTGSSTTTGAAAGGSGATRQTVYPLENGSSRPLKEAEGLFEKNDRLPRAFNLNTVADLKYTEDRPAKLISGHKTVKGARDWVSSKQLRMDGVFQPSGTRIVQVNVSADGPLPLPVAPSADPNVFIPGPVLEDTIGNKYLPFGYTLENLSAGQEAIEVNFDPGKPIEDLRQLPSLSKNKKQVLILFYRINAGVTLQSFSYGGSGKLTFKIEIPK